MCRDTKISLKLHNGRKLVRVLTAEECRVLKSTANGYAVRVLDGAGKGVGTRVLLGGISQVEWPAFKALVADRLLALHDPRRNEFVISKAGRAVVAAL
jgi:hypothetical protein